MKGTHVLVGEEGTISGGPPNLRGKTYKKRETSSDIPKQNTGAKYQREYSVVEKMAISDEMSAASYLMTACGVPFTEVKNYVDTGTAVENAKKVIEARRIETQKRFEACSEAQQKFMNMNPDEAKEFASECYLQEIDRSLNRGSHTQHMAQALGLNDKPKVVSREEFDKIAAQSPTGPVFRGVVDNLSAGVSADEIVDMTVSGELTFLGNGVHSDGIYFSTSKRTAEGYGGGDKGRVMEACFSSDARIVDYETLLSQKSSTPIGDTGTFALYSGYNAIRVKESGGEEYLIALDRSALVFCDSRGDSVTNGSDAVNGDELAKTFNAFAEQRNTDDSAEQQGVGVLVIVGGKILCGTRVKEGTICGPGGHIDSGETSEEAAIRETREEFGITPKELIPITTLTGMPEEYCDSVVYLCTEYDGTIACDGTEMTKPGFLSPEKALELMENKPGRLFHPFALSIFRMVEELFSAENSPLTAKDKQGRVNDGGGFEESKHPRDESGQFSSSGSGSSAPADRPATEVSPDGANPTCKGFTSPKKLSVHFNKHGSQLGFTDEASYLAAADSFLQQPCGGAVIGYSTTKGKVVRFNTETTEYASGYPGQNICTYMKAKCKKDGSPDVEKAKAYYEKFKKGDGC